MNRAVKLPDVEHVLNQGIAWAVIYYSDESGNRNSRIAYLT